MKKIIMTILPLLFSTNLFADDVSAHELVETARTNIIGFKKIYEGKTLNVTGTFVSLYEYGNHYVISVSHENRLLSLWVDCHLMRGQELDGGDFRSGDAIKVSGKIKYKKSNSFSNDTIIIADCKVVK